MDWDDYSSRVRDDYSSGALSGLFEGYHWCVDVERVVDSDEDSDPVSDTPSESASSSSAESEDDEGYSYRHCEGVYFPDERS